MTLHKDIDIFINAECFHKAGIYLQSCNDRVLLISSYTNLALALEGYYKTLYLIVFKENPPYKHDFHKEIYLKLPQEIRCKIHSRFNELSKKSKNSKVYALLKQKSGIKVSKSFEANLKNASSVFIKSRYLYEKTNWSFHFYKELRGSVLFALKELSPNLKDIIND